MIAEDALRFEPGSDFEYSSFGYSLLARQLELAAGVDFSTLVTGYLLTPAGMVDTAIDQPTPMLNRTRFYNAGSSQYTNAIAVNSSYKIAGGGLLSTPNDLVTLGLKLLNEPFVSERMKKDMWTPVRLDNGVVNEENYGLGWRINDSTRVLSESEPVRIVHHGGVQPGGACFYVLLPEPSATRSARACLRTGPTTDSHKTGALPNMTHDRCRRLRKA
jgi:serine beta-lactamase-like protein LACTB, mitochondrial